MRHCAAQRALKIGTGPQSRPFPGRKSTGAASTSSSCSLATRRVKSLSARTKGLVHKACVTNRNRLTDGKCQQTFSQRESRVRRALGRRTPFHRHRAQESCMSNHGVWRPISPGYVGSRSWIGIAFVATCAASLHLLFGYTCISSIRRCEIDFASARVIKTVVIHSCGGNRVENRLQSFVWTIEYCSRTTRTAHWEAALATVRQDENEDRFEEHAVWKYSMSPTVASESTFL